MTKTKTPNRKTPARGRTKGETRARGARNTRPYSEEVKAAAVAHAAAHGLAAASAASGVPKQTLSRWVKAAGVDLAGVTAARTKAATEARRVRHVEAQGTAIAALEHHITQTAAYLSTVTGINARAAQLIADVVDPSGVAVNVNPLTGATSVTVDHDEASEVLKLAQVIDALPLSVRDAEGVLTRAIHDLQLLNGEATERGTVVVEFAIPRPTDPAEVPTYPENPEG